MLINQTILILCAILLLMAIILPLFNPFLKKPKLSDSVEKQEDDASLVDGDKEDTQEEVQTERVKSDNLPPISIIIAPHNNAYELEQNLKSYLHQDYPKDFQVIVVADKTDSETEDVLNRYAQEERLYTTFIPPFSRYMSRKKLAVTLGVKAAKYEWILLVDITCKPQSSLWLKQLASHCNEGTGCIVGHCQYDEATPTYIRFEKLLTDAYLMKDYQRGMAYRCSSKALMFRRSSFLKIDGYRNNLKFIRGEYDFLVNELCDKDAIAYDNSYDGTLIEQEPTLKEWRNHHLFYLENRKRLAHSFAHRWRWNLGQWSLHLSFLIFLFAIIVSAVLQYWIVMTVSIVSLILSAILQSVSYTRCVRVFDVSIPFGKILFYQYGLFWHQLQYHWKYIRSNKDDFITHKL